MTPIDPAVQASVYEALASGNKTRNQLAAELALNPATVKTTLARMLKMGLVVTAGNAQTGQRGRPAFLYQQVPVTRPEPS